MLQNSVYGALMWCEINNIRVPQALLFRVEGAGIKTFDFFQRVLRSDVRKLYSGDITEPEFVDMLAELIPQQLRRAWNEGMRSNSLDPEKDMQPEWEQRIQNLVSDEFRYVDGFAADIVKAAKDGGDINALITRADLWANRYNDVVDRAKIATGEAFARFEWVLGPTDHCETCLSLGGKVGTAAQWDELEARGIYPRSPDLACHGFNCQCERVPTDKPLTDGGLGKTLEVKGYDPDQPRDENGRFGSGGGRGKVESLSSDADFYDNDTETAYIFSASGDQIAVISGNEDSVNLSGVSVNETKDGHFAHNHPENGLSGETWTFSSPDIETAVDGDFETMTATGKYQTYTMERPAGGWKDHSQMMNKTKKDLKLSDKYVDDFIKFRDGNSFGDSPKTLNKESRKFWKKYAENQGAIYIEKKRK